MKRLLAIPLLAVFFYAAQASQSHIDALPEKSDLTEINPFGKLPPAQYMAEYTASMLLGGLRAVAIDYLWIQYTKAERAHEYVEVNALLEILLRLQPSFAEVWKHLAWAQAYNIAAQQESEEDRWRWVKRGLECSEESVKRSPASEALLFHKGYMLYQRVPQERGLMDRYRSWTGHDCWQDAAVTLRKAIEMAQAKGMDNTIPPSDAMMQAAYIRWAFAAMRRGEFRAAAEVLREAPVVYETLMKGRPTTAINVETNRIFGQLGPAFRLEEELAQKLRDGRGAAEARDRLLDAYAILTKKFRLVPDIDERIIELTGEPVAEALRDARAGRAQAGADLLGRSLVPAYANLSIHDDGSENTFWSTGVRFMQQLQTALTREAEGKPAEALKKYEEILETFRYNLPGQAPQWPLIEKRAAELRETLQNK